MQRIRAFTLIEIVMSVFILMLLLLLAVPSLTGVIADRRLHRSLEAMNALVRQAQERSVTDRRPYLIVWQKDSIALRPEALKKGEEEGPVTTLKLKRGEAFQLSLPNALEDAPPAEWIFWPSGTCEPAVVRFKGNDGAWSANYSALTARPQLVNYATR